MLVCLSTSSIPILHSRGGEGGRGREGGRKEWGGLKGEQG